MEKKKFHILPVVLVTLLLLSISAVAVWAAINNLTTAKVENTFEPAVTSIEVNESFDGTTKSNVHITNTGSATYPKGPAVYVRVRLLAYWYDELQDRVVGKEPWTPSFTVGADWFLKGDYYYYKKPIEAGQSTSNLIDTITLETDADDGTRQVLEVIAEGIQSKPSNAVYEAWGVSVGSDGNIVQPQQ